jgi:hypothetical protein
MAGDTILVGKSGGEIAAVIYYLNLACGESGYLQEINIPVRFPAKLREARFALTIYQAGTEAHR